MHSPASKARSVPRHFYSLDALRGIAALAVVFFHWRHFFHRGTEPAANDVTQQPFYVIFEPLYVDGWRAVDLFFCLSGFIFFWLYSEKIAKRETSAKEFFVLRFSRLYPLHFLTLLIVAAGQYFMLWRYGSFFIYPCNDLYHFMLQTFFASDWGFERGWSFNGPIWSVSIEVLCYLIFFLVCLLRLTRWWLLGVFVCVGYGLQKAGVDELGRGVFSFFIGGLSFQVFGFLVRRGLSQIWLRWFGVLTGLLWVIIPMGVHFNWFFRAYRHCCGGGIRFHGKDVGGAVLSILSPCSFQLILFPATIVVLALWEMQRGTLGKRLAFLGHISYSSYLLHFPLQMLFVCVIRTLSVPQSFFNSTFSLLLFFGVLLPLSLGSYHFFERPCQSLIRGWAFGKK